MNKSAWDARMSRPDRMRAAWIDAMRSGQTKLPFAQFEERMMRRDAAIAKEEFFKRRIRVDWNAVEKALAQGN
jgi:hypothetical protein